MTTRIEARFAELPRGGPRRPRHLRDGGRSRPRDVAGNPEGLPKAGADIVEFGLPFTDPMADGPAIQAAGLRALKAGQNTVKTLELVRAFPARRCDTPIILMGYFNPIHTYGVDRFLADAKEAGVDGLIVVDLPPEEDDELCLPALEGRARLHPSRDADDRRQAAAGGAREHRRASSITFRSPASPASATPDFGKVATAVERIKRHTPLPVAVGFGVKTRRARGGDRAKAPTASWSDRRWSTRSRARSTTRTSATSRSVEAVTTLVKELSAGVRSVTQAGSRVIQSIVRLHGACARCDPGAGSLLRGAMDARLEAGHRERGARP